MSFKKVVAAFVLVDFLALNAYALYSVGLAGLVPAVTETNAVGHVLHVDLVIALTMVLVWLWQDAKRKGRNPWGYTLLTFTLGSVGPLVYVLTGNMENAAEADDEHTRGDSEASHVGGSSVSAGAR